MSYYAVTRHAGPAWTDGKGAYEQPGASNHAAFMNTLAEEGLVLVNVDTLADGEPRNNRLRRATFANGATAWNENGVLTGARHLRESGSRSPAADRLGVARSSQAHEKSERPISIRRRNLERAQEVGAP